MRIYAFLTADDFGFSPGISRGIIKSHRDGIVTSASLMAMGGTFEQAVTSAHGYRSLSLGIRLTLVERRPVLPPEKVPSLVTADGRFCQSLSIFLLMWLTGQIRMHAIKREFAAQIEKTMEHGIRIDKMDSHMHVHLLPGIFQAVQAVATRYGIRAIRIPRERLVRRGDRSSIVAFWRQTTLTSLATIRACPLAAAGLVHSTHFSGIAERGHLTEENLLRHLWVLQPGVTEVMRHSG